MATKFQYRQRTPEEMERALATSQSSLPKFIGDDFKEFRPHKGTNYIRILPPTWENAYHWAYPLFIHRYIGPTHADILCLAQANKGFCAICAARASLELHARESDKEQIRQLRWTKRWGLWLLDRQTDLDEAKGVQFWAMPSGLNEDIQKISKDDRTNEWFHIDHPERGYEVGFTVEGEKDRTRYTAAKLARAQTSVPQKYLDFVAEHPIDSILKWRNPEEVKRLFEGDQIETSEPTRSRQIEEPATDNADVPWEADGNKEPEPTSQPSTEINKPGAATDLRKRAEEIKADIERRRQSRAN